MADKTVRNECLEILGELATISNAPSVIQAIQEIGAGGQDGTAWKMAYKEIGYDYTTHSGNSSFDKFPAQDIVTYCLSAYSPAGGVHHLDNARGRLRELRGVTSMIEIGDPVKVRQGDVFWWDESNPHVKAIFLEEGASPPTFNVLTVVGKTMDDRRWILRHPTRPTLMYLVEETAIHPYTGEITVELQHRMDRERIAGRILAK